jgi:WD40 repeat protein
MTAVRTGPLVLGLLVLALSPSARLRAGDEQKPMPGGAAEEPLPAGSLARLGSGRFRDPGRPALAALAPDGKTLAVLSAGQGIRILEVPGGRERRRLPGSAQAGGPNLIFSPDGKYLAASGSSSPVQMWRLTGDTPALEFEANPAPQALGTSLAFSGNGAVLAIAQESPGRDTGKAFAWETSTGKRLCELDLLHTRQTGVALAPDGRRLASWGTLLGRRPEPGKDREAAETLQLWDTATGKEERRLRVDGSPVEGAAFSADGTTLAVFTAAGEVDLWEVSTGKRTALLAAQPGRCVRLTFSPDGKALALVSTAAGLDPATSIQLWEYPSLKRLAVAQGPACRFASLAFPAGGPVLACGIEESALRLWEVASGRALSPDGGHATAVTWVGFPGNDRLLSAGPDGKVLEWDPTTGKESRRLELRDEGRARLGVSGRVSVLSLSPDGKSLLCLAGIPPRVSLREVTTGRALLDLPDPSPGTPAALAAFSPAAGLVAVASYDGPTRTYGINFWDTTSGRARGRWKAEAGMFQRFASFAFSPDGKTLAAGGSRPGSGGSEVRLWDVARGEERPPLKRGADDTAIVAFSPDGKLLAAAGRLGITLYDGQGQEVGQFRSDRGGVRGAPVFSPDGRTLVAVAAGPPEEPAVLQLWEIATSSVRAEWQGNQGTVSALAFSPNGEVLASGGSDTTVLLWDVTGVRTRGKAPAAELSPKELGRLWRELKSDDARAAWEAMARLTASPGAAVEYLGKQLPTAQAKGWAPAEIERLVADLDSDEYAVREGATRELEAAGRAAEPALRRLLAGSPSAEVRKRAEHVLEALGDRKPSYEVARVVRAVEVLERVGTPQARAVLADLARGKQGVALTEEARAALRRLSPPEEDGERK